MIINIDNSNIWIVYALLCQRKSGQAIYIGICLDPEKRLAAHKKGTASKFTKSCNVISMTVLHTGLTKTEALRKEYKLKQLSAAKKRLLLQQSLN